MSDLSDLATYYGMTIPVVADPSWGTLQTYTNGHPNRVLFGPGAEILQIGGQVTDATIEAALPTPYP